MLFEQVEFLEFRSHGLALLVGQGPERAAGVAAAKAGQVHGGLHSGHAVLARDRPGRLVDLGVELARGVEGSAGRLRIEPTAQFGKAIGQRDDAAARAHQQAGQEILRGAGEEGELNGG